MEVLNWTKRAVLIAALGTLVSTVHAAETNTDVQNELQALKARIAELEKKEDANWLTEERTNQIKAIVTDAIADAKTRGQFADGDLQAGYNKGFFIQTADNKNKLVINGYTQFRYTYLDSNSRSGIPSGATSKEGNSNGFDFRRARFSLSGNVLTPDLTYMFQGDFAGSSSNNGNFQMTDYYLAYRFNPMLNVRAGSFLVPFTYAEYVSSGQQFVDFASSLIPFDPARALGVSLFGEIMPTKLSYEVNMNDGSKTNTLGKSDDTTSTGKLDNRMAFYGRMQFAGAGALSDFGDESDLRKDNSTLAWMLGGAAGYESQNSSTNAFPGTQNSLSVTGLPVNGGGTGYTSAALNGDAYRATLDGHLKYRGLSTSAALFFQQINQNPGAGVTLPYGSGNTSFYETGVYAQAGYFVYAKKLELAVRYSGIQVEGQAQHVDEYTGGANWYFMGQNNKLQADVTWMPRAFTNDTSTGQVVNTEDLLFRLQWQVKF